MRLDDMQRSDNVEDRRGFRPVHGIGIGTIVLLVVGYFMGVSPSTLLGLIGAGESVTQGAGGAQQQGVTGRPHDPQGDFAAAVLGETEVVWTKYFAAKASNTRRRRWCFSTVKWPRPAARRARPRVRSIARATRRSTSTSISSTSWPAISARPVISRAPMCSRTKSAITCRICWVLTNGSTSAGANGGSVAIELQADCLAGVWAMQDQRIIEPGEVQQALAAAAAVGDDTLQKRTQGRVVPDTFTHGTSAQRQHWFERGFQGGKIESCDTQSASQL